MSNVSIETRSIIQLCSSSISLISSTTIVWMIWCSSSHTFRTSPHPRIIFGLSIGDILQSLGFLLGPFVSPRGSDLDPWSIGNVYTCNFDGFLFAYGTVLVPFYLLLLALYLYLAIVKRMNNQIIWIRVERPAHIIIHVLSWMQIAFVLSTNLVNPYGEGSVCYVTTYPHGCWQETSDEQCTRGDWKLSQINTFLHPGLSYPLCFIATILLLSFLCRAMIRVERGLILGVGRQSCYACILLNRFEQRENETDVQFRTRMAARELVVQATLYILVFFLVYVVSLILMIQMRVKGLPIDANIVQILFIRGLYPLMGVFNLLIYTRSKVTHLRMEISGLSWFRSFCLVIMAKGDVIEALNYYSRNRHIPTPFSPMIQTTVNSTTTA